VINIQIKENSLENLELLIFDKDGTITDSNYYWQEIIKRRSKNICKHFSLDFSFEQKLEFVMGLDPKSRKLRPEGPIAIKSRDEVISAIELFFKEKGLNYKRKDFLSIFNLTHNEFEKVAYKFIKPIESATNFIKKMPNNEVKLALVTSDSKVNAKIALDQLGLTNKFDLIIGHDSGLGDKKNGGPAKFVCKTMGISPENTIALGDSKMDFDMSLKSNLKNCVLVATGQIPLRKLKKINFLSINSLSELKIYE